MMGSVKCTHMKVTHYLSWEMVTYRFIYFWCLILKVFWLISNRFWCISAFI